MIVEDLDKSTFNFQNFARAAFRVSERSVAKNAEQGRVAGENTHVTVFTRQLGFGNLSVYQEALRRGYFELESVGHRRLLQFLGGFQNVVNGALHVEGAFRQCIVLAVNDFLEAADGVGQFDVFALQAGKLLGHVEGL